MSSPLTLTLTLCAALAFAAPESGAQGKGKGGEHKDHGKAQEAGKPQKAEAQPAAKAQQARGKPERNETPNLGRSVVRASETGKRARTDGIARATLRGEAGGDVVKIKTPKANKSYGANRFSRDIEFVELRPFVREFAISKKDRERTVAGALARAHFRGVNDRTLLIVPDGDRVFIKNGKVVLLDLDDDRARNLGFWNVSSLADDNVRSGAPSFCRSGEGHPVWGRQWCLDKGFGLGVRDNLRWGYTNDLGDLSFRNVSPQTNLAREALIAVLGERTFNRLALHAVTLGLVNPLVGNWIGEPTGPRVMLLTSGGLPVAEIVDTNRDDRADRMLVALRGW
jgi:hypothetical protein